LPRDTAAAVRLGRGHDGRLPTRAWLRPRTAGRLQHALELRHRSFPCEEMVRIARRQGVALVASHTGGRWPYVEEVTTSFVYLRLHGPGKLYASDYRAAARAKWVDRVRAWHAGGQPADAATITSWPPPRSAGRDVWVFLDNTDKRHAPRNVMALAAACGCDAAPRGASPGRTQPRL
jgi:uncharacterized protein YecE (DUF72 family)